MEVIRGLYEYYDRIPDSLPFGLSKMNVSIILIINKEGVLENVEDTREWVEITPKGKTKPIKVLRCATFALPSSPIRSSNVCSNFMADNTKYLCKERYVEDFKNRIMKFMEERNCNEENLLSIVKFLENNPIEQFRTKISRFIDERFLESVLTGKENFTFKLSGNDKISFEYVRDVFLQNTDFFYDSVEGLCFITGKNSRCSRIHNKIKGVKDASSMGASISSYNIESSKSFGYEQNIHAPISIDVVDKYTKGLNLLLERKDNNIIIGQNTFVFWSPKKESVGFIKFLFGEDESKTVDSTRNVVELKKALNSIYTNNKSDSDEPFNIITLLPQNARLIVSDYKQIPVNVMCERINQHIDDLIIGDNEIKRLNKIIESMFYTKTDSLNKYIGNLLGDIIKSVLNGSLYPQIIVSKCIDRNTAERRVTKERASLLKMYWNKYIRYYKTNQKEITVILDNENNNTGYVLGRLFATIEKMQHIAQPRNNKTLSDSLMSSFSRNPMILMPKLMNYANIYKKQLRTGSKIFYDKMISELMSKIDNMPKTLNNFDRSMFFIGYFHQKEDFFAKKD